MLDKDRFICHDPDKLSGQWLADILAFAIGRYFFNTQHSFGRKKETRELFENLTPNLVIYTALMIHHALQEYETGVRTKQHMKQIYTQG